MNVTIQLNDNDVNRILRAFNDRQVPFAASQAINQTAKDFRAFQVRHTEEVFDTHNRGFPRMAARVNRFARKDALEAEIGPDPRLAHGKTDRTTALSQHEKGGTKTPRDGRSLFVPADNARRTARGFPALRKDYNFGKPRQTKGGQIRFGEGGMVMFQNSAGGGFMGRRRGRHNIELIA